MTSTAQDKSSTLTTALHRSNAIHDGRDIQWTGERARGDVPFLALYGMQIVLAYEWLLSGLDKLANPNFSVQLPSVLRGSTEVNQYTWYSSLLKTLVLPHASLLAPSVEVGELLIGAVLAISAVLWYWRPAARITRFVAWAAVACLVGSILLALNYSFQQGTPLPWINSSLAFSPGVGVDMLIALLSIPLLAANLWALRR